MHIDETDARKKKENVKNYAICHITRQNQYNPAGGGATISLKLLFKNIIRFRLFNKIWNSIPPL